MDTAKWIEQYGIQSTEKTNVGSSKKKIVLEYVWFSQKGLYLKVLGHLEVIGLSTKKITRKYKWTVDCSPMA